MHLLKVISKELAEDTLGRDHTLNLLINLLKIAYNERFSSRKYILLSSPSGSGKTFFMELANKNLDWDLVKIDYFELDEKIVKEIALSMSIRAKPRIILIENIDELSIKQQRKLYNNIKHIPYPIVFTASNLHKVDTNLVRISRLFMLNLPKEEEVYRLLKTIADYYKVDVEDNYLIKLSKLKSIRKAINSLFTGEVYDTIDFDSYTDLMELLREGKIDLSKLSSVDFILLSYIFSSIDNVSIVKKLSYLEYLMNVKYLKIDGYVLSLLLNNYRIEEVNEPKFLYKMKNKPSDNTLYKRIAKKLHIPTRSVPKEFGKLLYYIISRDRELLDMVITSSQPDKTRKSIKRKQVKKVRKVDKSNNKLLSDYF